jgi:microcystin-dependent protein
MRLFWKEFEMADPYIGEIRMFGGNFAPQGWAFCHGQLLAISENEALFNLIGTTYGGDGQDTFALPDLRGRVPIHMGTGPGLSSRQIGELAGTETVTLTANQIPIHTHAAQVQSGAGDSGAPAANAVWASSAGGVKVYTASATPPASAMAAGNIGSAGGNQPHENRMPFLAVNFIISLFGIFPSPN